MHRFYWRSTYRFMDNRVSLLFSKSPIFFAFLSLFLRHHHFSDGELSARQPVIPSGIISPSKLSFRPSSPFSFSSTYRFMDNRVSLLFSKSPIFFAFLSLFLRHHHFSHGELSARQSSPFDHSRKRPSLVKTISVKPRLNCDLNFVN